MSIEHTNVTLYLDERWISILGTNDGNEITLDKRLSKQRLRILQILHEHGSLYLPSRYLAYSLYGKIDTVERVATAVAVLGLRRATEPFELVRSKHSRGYRLNHHDRFRILQSRTDR